MAKIIVRNQNNPPPAVEEASADSQPVSFDIEHMLNTGGEILRREIRNLLAESSKGKLNAASARDLCAYIKLLSELKQTQLEELENLSDEDLKKLANEPKS